MTEIWKIRQFIPCQPLPSLRREQLNQIGLTIWQITWGRRFASAMGGQRIRDNRTKSRMPPPVNSLLSTPGLNVGKIADDRWPIQSPIGPPLFSFCCDRGHPSERPLFFLWHAGFRVPTNLSSVPMVAKIAPSAAPANRGDFDGHHSDHGRSLLADAEIRSCAIFVLVIHRTQPAPINASYRPRMERV